MMSLSAAAACFAASLTAAVIYLARNEWFGAGDLGALAIWTVPFALLSAALARRLASARHPQSLAGKYALVPLAGALCGLAWVVVVFLTLGAWIGAFSFPLLMVWTAGGIAAFGVAVTAASGASTQRWLAVVAALGFVCVAVAVGWEPAFAELTQQKEYTVGCVEWTPGPPPLRVPPKDSANAAIMARIAGGALGSHLLGPDDLATLESLGVSGEVSAHFLSVSGGGGGPISSSSSRMSEGVTILVVLQRHIDDTLVALPLRTGARVIYVQQDTGWRVHPDTARIDRGFLKLTRDAAGLSHTNYGLELPGRGTFGQWCFQSRPGRTTSERGSDGRRP